MATLGKDNHDVNGEHSTDSYVKLISSDDHEFYIKRDLALTSQTIKAMLSGPGLCFSSVKHKKKQQLIFSFHRSICRK